MCIAVLFTIARTQKQPKCLSTKEWVKKTWCIFIMEYYSNIKKNKINTFIATWMNPQIVILSEVRQRKKNIIWYGLCVESKKKNGTNESIYKTEIKSQMQKTNLWLPGGKRRDNLGDCD